MLPFLLEFCVLSLFCYALLSVLSSLICNHLDEAERERAGCFALIVFLMSSDCYCSVALPHGAVGVCDCGIS